MNGEMSGLWTIVWAQIWQISLLAIIVATLCLVVGRRWPHLAYALWILVLVKCFVPPVGNWPVNVLGQLTPANWVQKAAGPELYRDGTAGHLSGELTELDKPPSHQAVQRSPENESKSASPPTAINSPLLSHNRFSQLLVRSAPLIWLSGSVLLCGIAIGRGSEISRRLRRTSRLVSDELLDSVEKLSRRVALRRPARVLVTTSDIGPVVAGVWRPTIYLPEMLLKQLARPQVDAMLMHELAHVRRRDTWVAAIQFAAQAVWWFHPVVWWMNRRIARERERCCDEEVVANLSGKRSHYASLLVAVLEARHRLEPLWGYPAVRPVELTRRRLEEIMKRKNMVHPRAPRWCWIVAGLCGLVVWPGAVAPAGSDSPSELNAPRIVQNTPPGSRAASGRERPPALLSYGDGKADGKKSYGGSGHMIRFEMPEGVTKARGLRIHGSRYGLPQAPDEDFEVTFLSEDLEETLDTRGAPYRLFKRGRETWVRVLFDKEVELPKTFWVALNFNAHQTKGVYVSYDTSTKGEHSRVGRAGDEEPPKAPDFEGDWMVQLMLSRPESG